MSDTQQLDLEDVFEAVTGDREAVRTLDVGSWIRCERSRPSAGTWPRFEGRVGRVVTINGSEFGVRFSSGEGSPAEFWFLADELVEIERPPGAPRIRTSAERKGVS